MDVGIFNIFFDPRFDATALAAIFAFATIMTLGVPLLERNALGARMKAVAQRREEQIRLCKKATGVRHGEFSLRRYAKLQAYRIDEVKESGCAGDVVGNRINADDGIA